MKKRLNKRLWYGAVVDINGNPVLPKLSTGVEDELMGLNEGEVYIHNDDKAPAIYIRTNKDRIVAIGGGDIETLANIFLRKDKEDQTNFLLKLFGGVFIKKFAKFGEFITGVLGGYIDEKGNLEMDSGVFRKRLFVPEIAYNRTTYFKGRMVNSPGGGCTIKEWVDNGNGSYTIIPDLTDADGLSQFVDDILTTYFVTKNDDGKLNGFEEMKFRVTAADYGAKTFVMASRPGYAFKPAEQMVLAQTGNFTDLERQTYILIDSVNGNNSITFFDGANTWDVEPAQMKSWLGKRKGAVINGINAENYSAVLQNIIMTGLIFQVDEITGNSVRVPLDFLTWEPGRKYDYYSRVPHNGSTWLCVNEKGTTSEPAIGNPDWLVSASKGDKGDPGLSVTGGGHWESSQIPYKSNTIVSFANCVFLSKVDTSNPPIAISMFKGGTFRRMKNGGYILAGKSADWQVHPDWDMLLDGRELEGTSITFLGRFDKAPSNPKEGNSYYNTEDKATYIYQNGRWMLMVSDGKDGKYYEFIYTRGNIIDLPPDKPDSKQEDDYIPSGWTDDFVGVDEDHQVEWGCKRTKENGVWSEFSNPAVVHRWSKDGEPGKDGVGITAKGQWESSKVPYLRNNSVLFAGGTYLALRDTSNPPLAIARFNNGNYIRTKAGYILSGRKLSESINSDWQLMVAPLDPSVAYWIDSPVASINFTSTGTPSPSSILVTCKQSADGKTSNCSIMYLVARKYNGDWLAHVSPVQSPTLSVPATAGYTQFAVRAYPSASDANAWNSNYVAEKGIGVVVDGKIGDTGSFPRDRQVFENGQTYVWNKDNRDKIIYMISGVYYNFLVKNYGASVTVAPTSPNGDANWEPMQKFISIATDTLFADGANVANFQFKNGVMRSQKETSGVANLILNGSTGYFHCIGADISGKIVATSGAFTGAVSVGDFTINGELSADQGIYYNVSDNASNRYGIIRIQPRMFSSIPRNSLLQENNASMNVLMYLSRARNNVLDRVFYASGISEFNGRVAISSVNAPDTTATAAKPALFVEGGIGLKGSFHCEPITISTNTTLVDWGNTGGSYFNMIYYVTGNNITVYLDNVADFLPIGGFMIFITAGTNDWTLSCAAGIKIRNQGVVSSYSVKGDYEIWYVFKAAYRQLHAGFLN